MLGEKSERSKVAVGGVREVKREKREWCMKCV